MAILPSETLVAFSGAAAANVYCDSIEYEAVTQDFERLEFDNDRLKSAKTSTGAVPIIQTTFGGQPVQLIVSCISDSPRPLGPNTIANMKNIRQRFNIQRYTLTLAPSVTTGLASLFNLCQTHLGYLEEFNFNIAIAANGDISYSDLVSLQVNTFSNLTTTGLTMTGNAIPGGAVSNLLVTRCAPSVLYEYPSPGSGDTVYLGGTIVVEQRTITSQDA